MGERNVPTIFPTKYLYTSVTHHWISTSKWINCALLDSNVFLVT